MSTTANDVKVKAIFTKHGLGDKVIKGCWAQKSGERFILHRPDGSSVEVTEGQELRGGTVSVSKKVVSIGEACIPLFECTEPNLKLASMYARSTRGKKGEPKVFMCDVEQNGKDVIERLVEGKNHRTYGKVEVLPNGNLKAGNTLIAVAPKEYEVLLLAEPNESDPLIQSYKDGKPLKARMVTKYPGQKEPDTIHGYYFPGSPKKAADSGNQQSVDYTPASFCEYGEDGHLYATAEFEDRNQSSPKDRSGDLDKVAYAKVRSLEDAIQMRSVEQAIANTERKLEHITKTIQEIGEGFTVSDHPLYNQDEVDNLAEMKAAYTDMRSQEKETKLRFSFMHGMETMKRYVALGEKREKKPSNSSWGDKGP